MRLYNPWKYCDWGGLETIKKLMALKPPWLLFMVDGEAVPVEWARLLEERRREGLIGVGIPLQNAARAIIARYPEAQVIEVYAWWPLDRWELVARFSRDHVEGREEEGKPAGSPP